MRTSQQNKALHVLFEHIADELNGAGLDMRKALKPSVEIPWTKDTVKEYLWRPIQEEMLMKRSTTELTTQEIDQVNDTLNRYLAEKGLHVAFPSIAHLIHDQEMRDMQGKVHLSGNSV
jgi:hypothetical protein